MSNFSILIVEDELIIAKNTAKKLKLAGYEVPKIVSSGQAAISYIKESPPDLILMDIAIKGDIDGVETASQIKEIVDIPTIFLTAYATDEIMERASKTGCYGYLIKPFRDKELQASIKMALSKHKEQSTIQNALQSAVNEYSSQYDNIYTDTLTNLPNQLFIRDLFDYFSTLIGSTHTTKATNIVGDYEYSEEEKDRDVQFNLIGSTHTTKATNIVGDYEHPEEEKDRDVQLNLIGVFNIHLGRINKINDFLNKEQQDELVKQVAQRLSDCVGNFDVQGAIVYLERDNYVVISAIDNKQTAQKYGQQILDELNKVFLIDELEIFLPTSIGVAFSPTDSEDIEELLEQSSKAVEHVQKQGGNRCQLFTFAFNIRNSKASATLTMESYLHHALAKQELELYYQPKINLKNNSITGAEALIRWNHPLLGRIAAEKFIPIAEESGLIRPISEWVLETACQQTKLWHDSGLNWLKVGINISSFQFRQLDLFHQMTQTLFKTSLDPLFLELELTEKILVENIKTNIQRLNLIKKLGIQIALDDFGTGYSSLSYLQKFPFDILKIDACFIRNLDKDQVNAVITKNTIDMAHQLGLKVVAEGVETETELKLLQEYQCDEAQGFIFSRPIPAAEFKKLVIGNKTAVKSL